MDNTEKQEMSRYRIAPPRPTAALSGIFTCNIKFL